MLARTLLSTMAFQTMPRRLMGMPRRIRFFISWVMNSGPGLAADQHIHQNAFQMAVVRIRTRFLRIRIEVKTEIFSKAKQKFRNLIFSLTGSGSYGTGYLLIYLPLFEFAVVIPAPFHIFILISKIIVKYRKGDEILFYKSSTSLSGSGSVYQIRIHKAVLIRIHPDPKHCPMVRPFRKYLCI